MSLFPSETPLRAAIRRLESLNATLAKVRYEFLKLDAEKKHFEATLISNASGKSHAERVINAQASKEWDAFHQALVKAKARYEFEQLKFSVLEKEWQSLYLETKLDGKLITKQE